MGSIFDWSRTADSNGSADDGINWSEGQPPSTVNDSARTMMARLAEFLADMGGTVAATGTNALTINTYSAFTTLATGRMLTFKAAATNTSAVTVNVNSIGSKAIRIVEGGADRALAGGEIQAAGIYTLRYDAAANSAAGAWILENPASVRPVGEVAAFARSTAPGGWLACDGSNVSRTTYAALFTAIGTAYGAGDGSTTFALPDLREKYARGAGTTNAVGTSLSADIADHYHRTAMGFDASSGFGWQDGSNLPIYGSDVESGALRLVFTPSSVGVSTARLARTSSTPTETGSGETRPASAVVLYCIKF